MNAVILQGVNKELCMLTLQPRVYSVIVNDCYLTEVFASSHVML